MKRASKLASLGLVASVLSLCVAETVTRLLGLAPTVHNIQPGREKTSYMISDNPVLGYELKKNYRDIRSDSWESFAEINSHGQRDIERTFAKPPGTKRILMLGDSVVLGLAIRDLDDTITRRLERLYAASHPDMPVEVLNFGLAGYCTRGEAELLRVKGVKYDPDLVVVVFVENDFFDYNDNVWAYKFARPPGMEKLFLISHLFRTMSLRLDLFHFRAEVDPEYQRNWSREAIGANNVDRGLWAIRQMADEHGFDTILLAWPRFDRDKVSYPKYLFTNGEPRRLRVEAIAEKYGIRTVRLDRYFYEDFGDRAVRDEVPAGVRIHRFYTYDHWHPSSRGSGRVAEVIRRVLDEETGFIAAPD